MSILVFCLVVREMFCFQLEMKTRSKGKDGMTAKGKWGKKKQSEVGDLSGRNGLFGHGGSVNIMVQMKREPQVREDGDWASGWG